MTDAYKRAYEREKNARLEAEKLLDEKTREVQSSIDMIQHQFDDLMQQKKESDYLLSVSILTQGDENLKSVVDEYTTYSLDFSGALGARYSFVRDSKITVSGVIGIDHAIPELLIEIYQKLYKLDKRITLNISKIDNDELISKLDSLEIDRIGFIPIKCFGEVSNICEFYFQKGKDFKSEVLDQCEISAYQIGKMIEIQTNKLKLEENYQAIKESNTKLEQAQSQLVQSEKMASIGQLAAGVAHEINNPIGFVMSNIDTLKDYIRVFTEFITIANKLKETNSGNEVDKLIKIDHEENVEFLLEDVGSMIEDCQDGLGRVRDIVANLKSFARSDSEEAVEFDINTCIENSVKVVWNELKYKVNLQNSLADNLPKINGHEGQIGQVIMNMLVNASHAIEENGIIKISTSSEDDFIKVNIEDNGKGIPEEVKSKIFDPFFTTKPVNEGTGLGLSISYGILESHGGSIQVDSTEGEGTNFTLLLPVSQGSPAPNVH